MFSTSSLLGVAAIAVLAGCPDRTISEVEPQQGRVEYKDIPVNVNRNIDILFVVDDSPSMLDKQENLKNNFPNFINVLDTIVGGRPDLHIGVISTDLGARGSQDASPGSGINGCTGNGEQGNLLKGQAGTELMGTFISDIRNPAGSDRMTNYTGSLTEVFKSMASLGAGGCGFEQPLEAMKRALQNPTNGSFLREDAYLAVIFITDEDDCSFLKGSDIYAADNGTTGIRQSFRCTRFGVLCDQGGASTGDMNEVGTKGQCHPNDSSQLLTKVGDYVTFLKSLKPSDPDKIIVAGVMGTTEPFQIELRPPPMQTTAIPALAHSCTYQGQPDPTNPTGTQVADPPIRLKFFLDQFPGRSTFTTICQADLSGGLQQIAQLLKTVIGDPCIDGKLADVDPETDGDQYDCSVSWVSENAPERILPACDNDHGNAPCWEIVRDMVDCMGGENFKLKIDRGNVTPPEETHEVAYCVTEAVPAEDDDDN
jgi:hypothetical protein